MREQLKEILDQIDMESYLDQEGIQYRLTRGSNGQQLNVKECPFCGNRKWKVYIGANTGLGNCFSGDCGETFNKFSFIRANMPGASNSDVIRYIKKIATQHGWRQKKLTRFLVQGEEEIGLKFPDSVELPFKGKNLKYLSNRGITSDIASYFYLRYCKQGYFRYHDGERERVQDYSERVIIPVYDLDGNLVSFQGRDITGEAERKYLFPPGFASTGKYLYNGHNALGARRIVICEGAFDVMAAKVALDSEVALRDVVPVGSFGKHLSNGFGGDQVEQIIRLKKRGLKEVVFMWDGEVRALRDAIRSALVVSSVGVISKVAILPKDRDPNEIAVGELIAAFTNAQLITKLTAVKLLSRLSHE